MILSTIVGHVNVPKDAEPWYVLENEKFYKVGIRMNETLIPAVCSEYFIPEFKGRLRLQGYITNTYIMVDGKRKLFTYFRIMNVSSVEDDTPDGDNINLEVTVTRVGEMVVNRDNGRTYLSLVGRCHINRNRTAVVHMLAIEGIARKLRSIKIGDKIVATGHLHKRGEPVQVVLAEVSEITRKEEESNVG